MYGARQNFWSVKCQQAMWGDIVNNWMINMSYQLNQIWVISEAFMDQIRNLQKVLHVWCTTLVKYAIALLGSEFMIILTLESGTIATEAGISKVMIQIGLDSIDKDLMDK